MADDDKAPAWTPWFRLAVGDKGEPVYVPSPTVDRGHRELVSNLLGLDTLEELAEVERQLEGGDQRGAPTGQRVGL